jgi:hypothetical protein
MGKHFTITISDDDFVFTRKDAQIAAETALDGTYVLRTSVEAEALDTNATVKAYKQLANVERAFRSITDQSVTWATQLLLFAMNPA